MGLESTIICMDNSEYMRNGDFLPTRLQAQQDAVGMVAQAKLRSNPESNVGLVSLGSLEMLLTLTTDHGKALAKIHSVTPKGFINLIPAIKIAHLALKHRISKNHKTRIVAFVGSPITADEKELIKMAKKLKKEKVSLDIVSFGEVDSNAELLKKLIEAVNGKDGTGGSNLVTIPSGPHLTDALVSSPIVQNEGSSVPSIATGGGGFEFGVDPSEDPELAMALRISMEENRARQAAEDTADTKEEPASTQPIANQPEDEEMLARALAMSNTSDKKQEADLAAMTEEEQIEYAMKMSMQTSDDPEESLKEEKMDVDKPGDDATKVKTENESKSEDYSEVVNDPQFLQSVLESLPGVDAQSDEVRQAMEVLTGAVKKEEPKDDNSKN